MLFGIMTTHPAQVSLLQILCMRNIYWKLEVDCQKIYEKPKDLCYLPLVIELMMFIFVFISQDLECNNQTRSQVGPSFHVLLLCCFTCNKVLQVYIRTMFVFNFYVLMDCFLQFLLLSCLKFGMFTSEQCLFNTLFQQMDSCMIQCSGIDQ